MYFKCNVVNSFAECEHCGVFGKQVSYQARRFGHLYFIPLIPLGAQSQILNECKSCSNGMHIPIDSIGPMVESLKDKFKSWIMEIQDGKTEIVTEPGTEPVNVGVLIAGIIDPLYCLNEIQDIQSIIEILNASNLGFESEVVQGRWSEINGDLQQSKLHFQAAHRLKPDNPMPLFQMGTIDVKLGDTAGAEDSFNRYLTICPDDFAAYLELASLYEAQKNHPKIVETYDILYGLNPDLIPQKGMKKLYKKACKKSGVPGKFLSQM